MPRYASVIRTPNREIGALAGPHTRVLDLRGEFALPGFNDAHVHIEATGALLVGVNLLDVHEPVAFVERERAAAARLPRRARPPGPPSKKIARACSVRGCSPTWRCSIRT
ncbi:MAG TPA: hypothetical protein VHN14_14895 [Kofleriaceae bacterium]|jgi:hypothetical protein|nr:hypothetical protein [Kofleriaceae bacterium]